jgi:hypothetical protein
LWWYWESLVIWVYKQVSDQLKKVGKLKSTFLVTISRSIRQNNHQSSIINHQSIINQSINQK